MPIYQCVTSKTLSPETKAAIAKEITRIHVEFTAAPEPFINVVFSDLPLGSHYPPALFARTGRSSTPSSAPAGRWRHARPS